MLRGIFLSFRKDDPELLRRRVDDALVARFGRPHVFKAGASIPPGAEYPASLLQEASERELMLVLVGPKWLGGIDEETGQLRIWGERDWVHREVGESLRHGRRVIPVLVGDGAMLPAPRELPEDIRGLLDRQCLRIRDTGIDEDLDHLVRWLVHVMPELAELQPEEVSTNSSADSEPPNVQAMGSQYASGHGTNVVNSGEITASGHGSVQVGGIRNETMINQKHGGAAQEVAAVSSTATLAVMWTLLKRLKKWAIGHVGLATAAGVGAIVLGLFAVSLLPSPSSNPNSQSTPDSPSVNPVAAPITSSPVVPSKPAWESEAPSPSVNAVGDGTIPSAGTDTVKLEDGNANAWTETVAFGALTNGSAADQDALNAAAACVPSGEDVPAEAAVIPVQITFELTSAEPVNNFNTSLDITSNVTGVAVYKYQNGSESCSRSEYEGGSSFSVLSPNQPESVTDWIVLFGAYNGEGQPNISQIRGTYIDVAGLEAGPGSKLISASGPDVCGSLLVVPHLLATGLQPTSRPCTNPASSTTS